MTDLIIIMAIVISCSLIGFLCGVKTHETTENDETPQAENNIIEEKIKEAVSLAVALAKEKDLLAKRCEFYERILHKIHSHDSGWAGTIACTALEKTKKLEPQ